MHQKHASKRQRELQTLNGAFNQFHNLFKAAEFAESVGETESKPVFLDLVLARISTGNDVLLAKLGKRRVCAAAQAPYLPEYLRQLEPALTDSCRQVNAEEQGVLLALLERRVIQWEDFHPSKDELENE